ncbi:glutathione peroxidase [Vaginella massiliensis]|uniref:glutathione peroxidase n=1 Tax=Vaginella massiliensis TaxID=1816680 RepID=UPI00083959D4|nr:glutathione peroxidase [Vaginella massiliensis]
MIKYISISLIALSFLACNAQKQDKNLNLQKEKSMHLPNIYSYSFEDINGETYNFADLKGKKIIIVNTASKCGYTKQYEGLERIYQRYKDQGLMVIGFPSDNFMGQEYDNNEEIANFCKLNYGVTFPLMTKSDVKGKNQNEIFKFLTKKELNGLEDATVGWNFHKFLINEDGTLATDYPSKVEPESEEIIAWIENK